MRSSIKLTVTASDDLDSKFLTCGFTCQSGFCIRMANLPGGRQLIFSSSAAIYRASEDLTVDEDSAIDPQSPYARTKAIRRPANTGTDPWARDQLGTWIRA